MTMFTKLSYSLMGALMRNAIMRAWENRSMAWFGTGVVFLVAFVVMYFVLPRFLSKKIVRARLYSKLTRVALGAGLLCIVLSLSWGLGLGFGKGSGFGLGGTGGGKEDAEEKLEKREIAVVDGELNITIIGSIVYMDAVQVSVDELREEMEKKDLDRLKVVLIDDYSDYGTYSKVVSILNELLSEGKYEKRKGGQSEFTE